MHLTDIDAGAAIMVAPDPPNMSSATELSRTAHERASQFQWFCVSIRTVIAWCSATYTSL